MRIIITIFTLFFSSCTHKDQMPDITTSESFERFYLGESLLSHKCNADDTRLLLTLGDLSIKRELKEMLSKRLAALKVPMEGRIRVGLAISCEGRIRDVDFQLTDQNYKSLTKGHNALKEEIVLALLTPNDWPTIKKEDQFIDYRHHVILVCQDGQIKKVII